MTSGTISNIRYRDSRNLNTKSKKSQRAMQGKVIGALLRNYQMKLQNRWWNPQSQICIQLKESIGHIQGAWPCKLKETFQLLLPKSFSCTDFWSWTWCIRGKFMKIKDEDEEYWKRYFNQHQADQIPSKKECLGFLVIRIYAKAT